MADIEIEIDGKKLTARPDQTVIQVADEAGIYIPRFCYHKHLSIPANCRMCLVEVEKAPKTLPACATPCTPGMKVFTKSAKSLAAQRSVMEFLLVNHPLDCPICDQGGECELQDLSMGYGAGTSTYDECKRSVADEDLGPLIATEMTRCIACTRCVRFGDEIAGIRELGVIGRGEDVEISTYIQQAIESEVSGNIIDICPVGALTSKPYRFTARAWELDQSPSVSPHDCVGSNLHVHTRYGEVKRVVSRENQTVNETWISDRDRFSYTGLYHADRVREPMLKVDGQWQVVEWEQAFKVAAEKLKTIVTTQGADKIGGLASPNSTLEEFYLFQKLLRALGSPHIDHRLRATDTRDQGDIAGFPGLIMSLAELEQCDAIILIGSNIQKEQPLAGLRVRKATRKGAMVFALNPVNYRFNFNVQASEIVAPHQMIEALEKLMTDSSSWASALQGKQKVAVLVGAIVQHHPQAAALRALAHQFAQRFNGKLGILTDGANSAGAWLAGAIPHRHAGGIAIEPIGLNAYDMLQKPRQAYVLLNVEPDLDCANPHLATEALKQAECVIALATYRNAVLDAHADIIFPVAPFTETSGTYVNLNGVWQSFSGVAKPVAESRPAWKVLRVLANFLALDGFDYTSSEQVKHEVPNFTQGGTSPFVRIERYQPATKSMVSRVGEIPLYATDGLVRRSKQLQATQAIMEGELAAVRLHPETARKFHLQPGDTVQVNQHAAATRLPLILDERIALDALYIPGGIAATAALGDLFGEVEIRKI